MLSSRMALGALVVGVLALPLSGLAYEQVLPPLERTAEFKLASYVFEGQVKDLRRLDREGKPATGGPRFSMDLTVKVVRKSREKGKPGKGDTVSVVGWAQGKKKQAWLPEVKDEVTAFLTRIKGGAYEPIGKNGFKAVGGSKSASPAPDGPGGRGSKKE
jgi:hypothetical protein